MEQEPSFEEIIKQQKENCVFCKIIKGEIPAEKVYEDEFLLGIMDINPASDGHMLLMPKEHYPIMPLIQRDVFKNLFKIAKYIAVAQKEAFSCDNVSLFIANGSIAGQQSAHFMIHLIPRSRGDSLSMLDSIGDFEEYNIDLKNLIAPNLHAALLQHSESNPDISEFLESATINFNDDNFEKQEKPISNHRPTEQQKKKISQLYQENEEFRNLLMENTDELKEKINSNQEWAALFQGIDIDALVSKLREVGK